MLPRLVITMLALAVTASVAAADDNLENELRETAKSLWTQMHEEEAKPLGVKDRVKIHNLNEELAKIVERLEKYKKDAAAIAGAKTGTGDR